MSKYLAPAALFCAASLALSASVAAQEPMPPVDPVPDPAIEADIDTQPDFRELDKNNDGYIEKTDLPPEHSLALEFDAIDTNRDSRLSRVEFDARKGAPEEEEAEE